jgi:hypothetical protein
MPLQARSRSASNRGAVVIRSRQHDVPLSVVRMRSLVLMRRVQAGSPRALGTVRTLDLGQRRHR